MDTGFMGGVKNAYSLYITFESDGDDWFAIKFKEDKYRGSVDIQFRFRHLESIRVAMEKYLDWSKKASKKRIRLSRSLKLPPMMEEVDGGS